jgi:hypothetical protein
MITISSQRYLDDDVVDAKRANRDYAVLVSAPIEYNGNVFRVVLDGHHSLAAAKLDGITPEFDEATLQQDDAQGLPAEQYLEIKWIDSDYYDVMTGNDVLFN